MKLASKVTSSAKEMIKNGYYYLYGAKGQKITKTLVNVLANTYKSVYNSAIISLAKSKIGKGYGIDCSGFVSKATKTNYGGSSEIRRHMYDIHRVSDKSHIVDGMVCHRNGHVGLIEVTKSGKAYVLEAQSTATDLKRTPIDRRLDKFTVYGKLKGVNYLNANKYKKSKSTK